MSIDVDGDAADSLVHRLGTSQQWYSVMGRHDLVDRV